MANSLLDHLRELIDEASAGLRGVAPRRMFGCHAVFADGNIYGLVWKEGRLGLRLPEAERYVELLALPGAEPWSIGEKIMSHWVLVPEEFHDDTDELERWVKVAHALAIGVKKPAAKPKPAARPKAPATRPATAKKPAARAKDAARRTNGRSA